jgi:apolipoprotein N-acyltransferase
MQVHLFRAIENGVTLVRPTGDGISLVVDPLGRVLATADDFVTDKPLMMADVPVRGTNTLYARIGDLFVYLCLVGWVMLVSAAFWPRRAAETVVTGEPVHA